ncbi:polyamine ABC transporter substrate-binding protein [Pseudogulbenkiania subflava]|uniref:Putrescine-binding periplasmic protein n=1 Tax=Pseudogulbenkiania subflava DSM 22618 TaxID=1123014 RepID=A0A1Y6BSM8_9NEIS|nr:polyamine ABC transporter substrate-binding protein [Pseudogulbenkiania subflava]SMF19132.1 putrescine transport system substrate-binding protein [Pseudogulbenkiania subflava DSM 22618]
MKRKAVILVASALATAASASHAASSVLNVYNWSDYIAEDTIPTFQKQTGIKVRYDVYDSNEILQAKMLTGKSGYDIVVPTNQFLAKQIQAGIYQPIDKSKLSNYKELDPELLKLMTKFDPDNKYAVPYFWGVNTIGINTDKVTKALGGKLPEKQWDILFKKENVSKLKSCGVSVLDSPGEVFPMVLKYLGKDPASKNEADYKEAAALLKTIRPYITRFSSSGYINELAGGNLCLVYGYGGDLNIARVRAEEAKNKVKITPLVPKEGVAIWVDSMVIPKDAKNVDNAYKFIDYNMSAKVAAANANTVNYAPGSLAARKFIKKENLSNPSIFPTPQDIQHSFVMLPMDPKLQRLTTRLWQEIKTQK